MKDLLNKYKNEKFFTITNHKFKRLKFKAGMEIRQWGTAYWFPVYGLQQHYHYHFCLFLIKTDEFTHSTIRPTLVTGIRMKNSAY